MSLPAKADYRPDVDGIRAVSILGVILFHINPSILPGGFLGVDVFFVISGFLISGIIMRGLERGDFSFTNFYERRIRRLMPALLALILVVSAFCLVWMWPADLKDYAKSVKFVALSLANVHYLGVVGDYFNERVDEVPLLHTWSLAVEEQFYLVFPLLLLALKRLFGNGRGLVTALWVLFISSLVACLWRGQGSPMSSFFLLPYRAWELLAGALLAVHSIPAPGKRTATFCGCFGLLMILASLIWVSEGNLVPGLSAVPACFGAVLLIHAGALDGAPTRRLLGTKPMVGLGLISYSVYLWHWPLVVFWKAAFGSVDFLGALAVFTASIAVGWLSWKCVEQPFRERRSWSRRRVYSAWAVATLVLVLGSQLVRNARGLPWRFPKDVQALLAYEKKEERFTLRTKEHYDPSKAPVFGDVSVEPTVAVWGDSHAEALLPVLERMAQQRNESFVIYSAPGQIPVPDMIRKNEDDEARKKYTGDVLSLLKENSRIRTVVLHARWSTAIWGDVAKNGLQPFYGRDFKSREEVMAGYRAGVERVVNELLAAGKRVVIIYPVPELRVGVPRLLAKRKSAGESLPETIACGDFMARNGDLMGWFDSLPEGGKVVRIRPHEVLYHDGMAKIMEAGAPLYRDSHHLSSAGADILEDILEPVFGAN